jgi:hypothetical protein
MSSRRALGVSNPRDMIYAHLGMIDFHDDYLTINYDRFVAQAFENVASLFARTIPNFSILLHVEV